jgi:rubrerythrin
MSVFKEFADIVEVAVRIERHGTEFYKRLYDSTESHQAKSVFSVLAAEEEKHAGLFRTMLEKIADYTPRYDYPGEYGLFLNDIASDIVRKMERDGQDSNAVTTSEALDRGIEFEKETILFYLEMKSEGEFAEDKGHILLEIINQERAHWKKLQSLKTGLKL